MYTSSLKSKFGCISASIVFFFQYYIFSPYSQTNLHKVAIIVEHLKKSTFNLKTVLRFVKLGLIVLAFEKETLKSIVEIRFDARTPLEILLNNKDFHQELMENSVKM